MFGKGLSFGAPGRKDVQPLTDEEYDRIIGITPTSTSSESSKRRKTKYLRKSKRRFKNKSKRRFKNKSKRRFKNKSKRLLKNKSKNNKI